MKMKGMNLYEENLMFSGVVQIAYMYILHPAHKVCNLRCISKK